MCTVMKTNHYYKTREGYDAYVAGKNPWPENIHKDLDVYVGYVKDHDGNASIVHWDAEGHIKRSKLPHMNDIDDKIEPVAA